MRNAFEQRVADELGPGFQYEAIKLPYVIQHTYLPDFIHREQKRIIEAKGFFPADERRKMKAVKAAYPDWSVEIWFTNPNRTISKSSSTTYAEWCRKNGIIAKQGPIPQPKAKRKAR